MFLPGPCPSSVCHSILTVCGAIADRADEQTNQKVRRGRGGMFSTDSSCSSSPSQVPNKIGELCQNIRMEIDSRVQDVITMARKAWEMLDFGVLSSALVVFLSIFVIWALLNYADTDVMGICEQQMFLQVKVPISSRESISLCTNCLVLPSSVALDRMAQEVKDRPVNKNVYCTILRFAGGVPAAVLLIVGVVCTALLWMKKTKVVEQLSFGAAFQRRDETPQGDPGIARVPCPSSPSCSACSLSSHYCLPVVQDDIHNNIEKRHKELKVCLVCSLSCPVSSSFLSSIFVDHFQSSFKSSFSICLLIFYHVSHYPPSETSHRRRAGRPSCITLLFLRGSDTLSQFAWSESVCLEVQVVVVQSQHWITTLDHYIGSQRATSPCCCMSFHLVKFCLHVIRQERVDANRMLLPREDAQPRLTSFLLRGDVQEGVRRKYRQREEGGERSRRLRAREGERGRRGVEQETKSERGRDRGCEDGAQSTVEAAGAQEQEKGWESMGGTQQGDHLLQVFSSKRASRRSLHRKFDSLEARQDLNHALPPTSLTSNSSPVSASYLATAPPSPRVTQRFPSAGFAATIDRHAIRNSSSLRSRRDFHHFLPRADIDVAFVLVVIKPRDRLLRRQADKEEGGGGRRREVEGGGGRRREKE
eukprot:757718-Hanusia_phi.AAC.4